MQHPLPLVVSRAKNIMRRSSDYNAKRQQGRDTTSHDYLAHVSRMERMVSVHPDLPHYPNVHTIFNNRFSHEEVQESQNEPQNQEVHEKVEVVEQERTTEKIRRVTVLQFLKGALMWKPMPSSSKSTRGLSYANGRPSNCVRLRSI
ncbi:hypothetical protein L1049_027750 [Liquidambar formosana]|uniref:Uncharacterized protein n=1 Tax=Liquidambar formosana TaxID=63359 RepID=A0AAP0RIM4_LIQFO